MPEIPNPTWKRLTVEEVRQKLGTEHLQDDPHDRNKKALLNLIEKDEVTAWLKPNGEVAYQHKPKSIRGLPKNALC
jgi:hypothetical protein